jgi:hypothetical protein
MDPTFSLSPQSRILAVGLAFFALASFPLNAQDEKSDNQPFLPAQVRVVSTIPANGDLNPYGVATVPRHFSPGGLVNPGDILVSNFNSSSNLQGTGTTIVRITANGPASLFFQGAAPLGLTTALNVLRAGFVLVGNFPSPDLSGSCTTAGAGSILVVSKNGQQIGSITDATVNGPWDSTLIDEGTSAKLFVANGLTGAITRLDLAVGAGGVTLTKATIIASGYGHQCDQVTFVDAPTGLVYDSRSDALFVASTLDNAIFAVPDARNRTNDGGIGKLIYQDPKHLHGALAMEMAPNNHLLVSNNDAVQINPDPNQPSEIVEFTKEGKFVREISVDQNPGGAFGLDVATFDNTARFAFVDDNTNSLSIWSFALPSSGDSD